MPASAQNLPRAPRECPVPAQLRPVRVRRQQARVDSNDRLRLDRNRPAGSTDACNGSKYAITSLSTKFSSSLSNRRLSASAARCWASDLCSSASRSCCRTRSACRFFSSSSSRRRCSVSRRSSSSRSFSASASRRSCSASRCSSSAAARSASMAFCLCSSIERSSPSLFSSARLASQAAFISSCFTASSVSRSFTRTSAVRSTWRMITAES